MPGILKPNVAFQLVTTLKRIGLPIDAHSHCTAVLEPMAYLKAVEGRREILDCATPSMSGATSQSSIESLHCAFKENYLLELNLNTLQKVADHFWEIREGYERFHYAKKERPIDPGVIMQQIPCRCLATLSTNLNGKDPSTDSRTF